MTDCLVRLVRLVAVSGMLALGACAGTPQLDHFNTQQTALPSHSEVAQVPFYPQDDLYCGPAALAMVMSWSGERVTQHEIATQVYTPGREGTLRSDMAGAARRNGRLAVPLHTLPELLGEIAAGHPVIVFQNLGLSFAAQWHYAVAIGYDLDRQELILHSGTDERRRTSLDTFERTWRRGDYWALLVLPPDRMPATLRLQPTLTAAVGIERVGRLAEAATAYRAIADRWPDDDAALIGLANIRYAQANLPAAAAALEEAIARNPDSAPAWNNLAVVLGEMGHSVRARAAAERAIAIDGSNPTYRETLADVD